ncbi:hypothetical protein HanPI659440_Chr13g0523671 [Helianthus annuus]|nr:hypothetical protein HanPI659440_Chr13g0523671 [Helianthus annuus]
MEQSLNLGQFFPQFLELGVNALSASTLLEDFISKLLNNDFDKGRNSGISHC